MGRRSRHKEWGQRGQGMVAVKWQQGGKVAVAGGRLGGPTLTCGG